MSSSERRQEKKEKYRFLIYGGIISVFLAAYLVHLFSMQVVESLVYQNQANVVSNRSQVIPTQRGRIYDRNVTDPIASNQSSFALQITPGDLETPQSRDTLVTNLSRILHLSTSDIERLVPLRSRNFDPVKVFSNVPFQVISEIAENIDDFPALSWTPLPQRFYPEGENFAHVLGYVGDINQQELQVLFNQGYNQNSIIGKTGIEQTLDLVLKGKDGLAFNQVDVFGRRSAQPRVIQEPELGDSVVLTLDRKIQQLSIDALGGRIGTALVLNPRTGEILSLVSNPGYDPNSFYGQNGSQNFTRIQQATDSPFINRNIQSAAPPASTFKILMSIIAMEEKAIDPLHTVRCTGSIAIGDRIFRCNVPTGHGDVNLYQALAQSCNVYFYSLAYDRLRPEDIFNYAQRLGFGNLTGIDLPGEVRGLVPSREWKERTFNTPWVGGDTVNLSIGQGFMTVTPLQLSNLTASIANGGPVYTPHIVKEIRDPITLELKEQVEPTILFDSDLNRETIEIVREAMRKVITEGTANVVITTPSVTVAGKTGTAQTGDAEKKHSWFTAYAPYDTNDPRDPVVVTVWVDAANDWDWWAPKAANFILHGIYNDMTYAEVLQDLRPLWYITREMLNGEN
ncbi:MAG: penicillin-binding protein 2 [Spirochaetales bacterium]|nr:penicillin-binding protein 2 [Spirochaetales bacterium]